MKTRGNLSVRSRLNWNLEVLVFKERGKPEYLRKNLSEEGREPTTNSTHMWCQRQNLNPGNMGGRRLFSPLRHSCSYSIFSSVVAQSPGNSVTVQYDETLRQLIIRLDLNSIFIIILFPLFYLFLLSRWEGLRGGHFGKGTWRTNAIWHKRLCGHILAVAVQHNALNMLPIQAAKSCTHIGFGVANRTKNNEQLKSVTVVFIVLFCSSLYLIFILPTLRKRDLRICLS